MTAFEDAESPQPRRRLANAGDGGGAQKYGELLQEFDLK